MRKTFLLSIMFGLAFSSYSATVTIQSSGFTFSPAVVEINLGDTVIFSLGEIHNAVEVSESTWNTNGNTPLPGFSVPFGGGMVTGLTAGDHYYVCTPHASGGMKGKISVHGPSGISSEDEFAKNFRIYPNPTHGFLVLEKNDHVFSAGPGGQEFQLEIFNMAGQSIYALTNIDFRENERVDISSIPSGNYIIAIRNDKRSFTTPLIKE